MWETSQRLQWDKKVLDYRVLEEFGDHQILYYLADTPMFISKRDFVIRRSLVHDYPAPGCMCIHTTSVLHQSMPPINGNVRGEVKITGFIIRPSEGSRSIITSIIHSDPKGNLPKSMVNKGVGKNASQWLEVLEGGCRLLSNSNS